MPWINVDCEVLDGTLKLTGNEYIGIVSISEVLPSRYLPAQS